MVAGSLLLAFGFFAFFTGAFGVIISKMAVKASAWVYTTVDDMSSVCGAQWFSFILASFLFWQFSNFRKFERQ